MLQPVDRAIIRELNVRAGDLVKKGQVLATLDPTFASADLVSVSAQQRALDAKKRRLQAELDGTPFVVGDPQSSDDQLQANLFRERQAQYQSRLRAFDEEIQRRQAAMRTAEDDRTAQTKQLAIAKEVENMRSTLMQSQIGSKLQFLEAQGNRMRIEQELQMSSNHLVELQHDLQSKQAERQAFIDEWRHDVLESLVSTRTEATQAGQGEVKASRIHDLVVETAPTDGVVLDVANRSVGSVLQGAEPLITMIPSDAKMIAEIMISSGDVGFTRTGEQVIVKVDAFPYQRFGYVHGVLNSVSEESFSSGAMASNGSTGFGSQGPGAFHRGRVELTDTNLENLPPGARLIPGMTLTAEIKVGRRSIMEYLLYPITRGFSESIREP